MRTQWTTFRSTARGLRRLDLSFNAFEGRRSVTKHRADVRRHRIPAHDTVGVQEQETGFYDWRLESVTEQGLNEFDSVVEQV